MPKAPGTTCNRTHCGDKLDKRRALATVDTDTLTSTRDEQQKQIQYKTKFIHFYLLTHTVTAQCDD